MQQVRKLIVNERDFVSWTNVWRLVQVLFLFQAWMFAKHMPLQMLVVAVIMIWLIYQANKF